MDETSENPEVDPAGQGAAIGRRSRLLPVAMVTALAVVVLTVFLLGGGDGDRSVTPASTVAATTTGLPPSSATAPASIMATTAVPTAVPPSASTTTTVPPTVASPRPTVRATIPPAVEPTTTWQEGLDGTGWITDSRDRWDMTACETLTYTVILLDPLRVITSASVSWSYPSESGGEITGVMPLTMTSYEHLDGTWVGTFRPSGSPPAGTVSAVSYTLVAFDGQGNSKVLNSYWLTRLSPCPSTTSTSTTSTGTSTTTTATSPPTTSGA